MTTKQHPVRTHPATLPSSMKLESTHSVSVSTGTCNSLLDQHSCSYRISITIILISLIQPPRPIPSLHPGRFPPVHHRTMPRHMASSHPTPRPTTCTASRNHPPGLRTQRTGAPATSSPRRHIIRRPRLATARFLLSLLVWVISLSRLGQPPLLLLPSQAHGHSHQRHRHQYHLNDPVLFRCRDQHQGITPLLGECKGPLLRRMDSPEDEKVWGYLW